MRRVATTWPTAVTGRPNALRCCPSHFRCCRISWRRCSGTSNCPRHRVLAAHTCTPAAASPGRRPAIPQISVATNWRDKKRLKQPAKSHVRELPEQSCLPTRRGFHLRSDKKVWTQPTAHGTVGLEPSILCHRHRRLWQNVQSERRCIVGHPGL